MDVRHVAHEVIHEFLHLDGKIFQTLRLLISRPGALTAEFFRGRRERYVSPVRLYLTCSLLYFAFSALAPGHSGAWKVNATDVPSPEVRDKVERVERQMDEVRLEIPHQGPRLMFVLMPLFALITWGFYRASQPHYVAHLYYSLHFHAFVFLLLFVADVLALGRTPGSIAGGIVKLSVIPYHYIAIRRVFGGSRTQAAWKATAIFVLYALVVGLIMVAILAWIVNTALRGA
jgi:hypothetical protein